MTTFHKYRFDLFDPLSKFETYLQTKINENKVQTLAVISAVILGRWKTKKAILWDTLVQSFIFTYNLTNLITIVL